MNQLITGMDDEPMICYKFLKVPRWQKIIFRLGIRNPPNQSIVSALVHLMTIGTPEVGINQLFGCV